MSELSKSPEEQRSGLAYLYGLYLGFRLFIMLLVVVLLRRTPQEGVICDLAIGFLLFALAIFCRQGDSAHDLQLLRTTSSRWAILFLAVTGCSLVWSVSFSLPAAVVFWCAMVANCIVVIVLMRTQAVETVVDALLKGFAHGACAVALVAWLLPGSEDSRLGLDGLIGTNVIGYLCAFGFYCAQYLVMVRKEKHTFALAILGLTMLRSLSKTTIIAFLVSQAFLLAVNRAISRRKRLQIALAAVVLVLPFWAMLSSYVDNYASSSQSENLTGRLGIWLIMISDGLDKPLLGHGFHSVWQVIPPFGPEQFEVRHAHNELIQQFYAYGITGLALFCGIYVSFFLQVRKLAHSPLRSFLFGLLIFVLIRGVADTETFDFSLPMWMILLFSVRMRESEGESRAESEAGESDETDGHALEPAT